ncbi:isocitrate lyase/PEP mutase family protein [Flavobacterium johnsoniae]|uniref:2-Methylisocitrate lyase, PEP mutase family n=1 Tax=Flavobacterium johnsoniae TaxID=986 RepID=A0A1M5RXW6_FLAJO|nr:isocitrate lyase/phosphoenolpyruvate mutase family protein [Flavobacterium johnsoniae]SHH31039.1 2-Methylisocitrate lyase, PEP mutase family [Flavobacterium johnsoniae]
MTNFEEFKILHSGNEPLLLANVWNVQSALQYEKLGFKAIGTSSAAIAAELGYEDGEKMPFEEYLFMIKRIKSAVQIPLTVDLEGGYGKNAEEIISNIIQLHEIGAAGINIEDSVVVESGRKILDAADFTFKLKRITENLKSRNRSVFINVRSDVFLLNLPNPVEESKQRIKQYEAAGINGIFLPCITNENHINEITRFTKLPVNVMCMPDLLNFEKLKELGVKRISMGNFVHSYLYNQLEKTTQAIIEQNSFAPIF